MYILAFILQAVVTMAFWLWIINIVVDKKLKKLKLGLVEKTRLADNLDVD